MKKEYILIALGIIVAILLLPWVVFMFYNYLDYVFCSVHPDWVTCMLKHK